MISRISVNIANLRLPIYVCQLCLTVLSLCDQCHFPGSKCHHGCKQQCHWNTTSWAWNIQVYLDSNLVECVATQTIKLISYSQIQIQIHFFMLQLQLIHLLINNAKKTRKILCWKPLPASIGLQLLNSSGLSKASQKQTQLNQFILTVYLRYFFIILVKVQQILAYLIGIYTLFSLQGY